MANIFLSDQILLSGQLLTATGNQLYLNEFLVGANNFDIPLNIFNTGQIVYNDIVNLSGGLSINLQNTGRQSWSAANDNSINLSGNLEITGQTLYNDATGLNNYLNSSLSGFITGTSGYLRSNQTKIVSFQIGSNGLSQSNPTNAQTFLGKALPYYTDLTNFTGIRLILMTGPTNVFSTTGIIYIGFSQNILLANIATNYTGIVSNNIYKGTQAIGQNLLYNSGFQPISSFANKKVGIALLCSGGSGGSSVISILTARIDLM